MVWLLPLSLILPERGAAWSWLLLASPLAGGQSKAGLETGGDEGGAGCHRCLLLCMARTPTQHAEELTRGPGVSWDGCDTAPQARQLKHQKFILSQFWRPEADPGSRLIPPKAVRENLLRVLPGSDDPLALLGIPGLVDAPPHLCFSLPLTSRVCPESPLPTGTLGPTLTHCGLSSCPLRPCSHQVTF